MDVPPPALHAAARGEGAQVWKAPAEIASTPEERPETPTGVGLLLVVPFPSWPSPSSGQAGAPHDRQENKGEPRRVGMNGALSCPERRHRRAGGGPQDPPGLAFALRVRAPGVRKGSHFKSFRPDAG